MASNAIFMMATSKRLFNLKEKKTYRYSEIQYNSRGNALFDCLLFGFASLIVKFRITMNQSGNLICNLL